MPACIKSKNASLGKAADCMPNVGAKADIVMADKWVT